MKILRKLRELENIAISTVAQYLDVTNDAISKFETGKKNPYFPTLLKLSKYYNVSVDCVINDGITIIPKNLKLINTALKIDQSEDLENINLISGIIKKFSIKKFKENWHILLDNFDEKLTNNFHENIKIIRHAKELSQTQMGNLLKLNPTIIFRYETDNYPPIPKLKLLSDRLSISAHFLCTGEKLSWTFKNNDFFNLILKADHFCNLDEHRMLIYIMTKMLEN